MENIKDYKEGYNAAIDILIPKICSWLIKNTDYLCSNHSIDMDKLHIFINEIKKEYLK